jgi:hypothetical protein
MFSISYPFNSFNFQDAKRRAARKERRKRTREAEQSGPAAASALKPARRSCRRLVGCFANPIHSARRPTAAVSRLDRANARSLLLIFEYSHTHTNQRARLHNSTPLDGRSFRRWLAKTSLNL